ncbi:olfactory receptor 2AT4-like [Chanos chanos]|uniref:Olfactory receptor 2AT4-like n=1 Tax=Chanos chanos TaxID=29144 RepID=A0A6J2VPS3_CHACN|nr:olfactory receptor 2AT4-like [Chanos chanos]
MNSSNVTTTVTEFILMGFPGLLPQHNGLAATTLFLIYIVLATGNIFIIVFVAWERSLRKPTYFIFCNLALCDLSFGTATLPRVISRYWTGDKVVSFNECFTQMYFVHFLGANSSFLLALMALDQFIAINYPLRYPILMKNSTITVLCTCSWLFNVIQMAAVVIQALSLHYCGPNVITQCYCDHIAITRLACENVREIQVIAFGKAMFILLGPLSFIIFSYISIIISVMKISNTEGRYKTFSTCTPQLLIICLYYLPRSFVYLANNIGFHISTDIRIMLIMCYSLFPALINPFIYCFRTKEIKEALIKRFKSR